MPTRLTVLVAEDSDDDAVFLKRGFLKAGINVPLMFVCDGKQAVEYLNGTNQYADRAAHPFPRLLLLDIKMPQMGGFDVLRWLKTNPNFKRLAVTMFSSSSEERDVNLAYDLGANSYLVKPSSIDEYARLAQVLNDYWLQTNICPTCPASKPTSLAA